MWGSSIVGFGSRYYNYASGREGGWFLVGFSPRKQNLTLYTMDGFERCSELLHTLGTDKTGKSCLYIKGLEDVNMPTLRELLSSSVANLEEEGA
jgi:hypothetical protein